MRRYLYWAGAFAIGYIALEELSLMWWKRVTPAHMYSLITKPTPTVGWGGGKPIITPKGATNNVYQPR